MELLSVREKDGREGVESGASSASSSASSRTTSGGGLLLLADVCVPVSFCKVVWESDVGTFEPFSSGVVGLDEQNSDEAEWKVASDAVEAEGGCGYIAVSV